MATAHGSGRNSLDGGSARRSFVGHDRRLLDRPATHILAFDGNSRVVFTDGNYGSDEAARKKRLGIGADPPHRIKYRKRTK